jgi:hypothetical protein
MPEIRRSSSSTSVRILRLDMCYRHNLTGPKDGPRATWAKENHRNGLPISLYANVSGARMAVYLRIV